MGQAIIAKASSDFSNKEGNEGFHIDCAAVCITNLLWSNIFWYLFNIHLLASIRLDTNRCLGYSRGVDKPDQPEKIDPSVQMRALRFILGRDYKPLSSEELAGLIYIPPVAIRAIESRRRKFSQMDRIHISTLLGATWDDQQGVWVDVRDGELYTKEFFILWQSSLNETKHPQLEALQQEYLHAVELFWEKLPPSLNYLVVVQLYGALKEIADRHHIPLEALEQKPKGH